MLRCEPKFRNCNIKGTSVCKIGIEGPKGNPFSLQEPNWSLNQFNTLFRLFISLILEYFFSVFCLSILKFFKILNTLSVLFYLSRFEALFVFLFTSCHIKNFVQY